MNTTGDTDALKKALTTSQGYVSELVEKREELVARIRETIDGDIEIQMNFQRALVRGEAMPAEIPRPKNLPGLKLPAPGVATAARAPGALEVEFTGGSLKARIFRFFGAHGDGKTVEEIALGISEPNTRRIVYCLRDARAKDGFLDLPGEGKWSRSRKGRLYSEQLLSELTQPAAVELPMHKK
jgi:hypothetical protein